MSAAFWKFALAPVLALLALLATGRPAKAQCTTTSGLTYATYVDGNGQTQPLQLDLMLPSGAAAPLPLVIWIHGGGWSSGSRTPIPNGPVGLCSRGYAVASIDYRLYPAYAWPTQIQDAKGAVRWLRANAATYGLDPDRFGAWGESAGGHLAAMLGTTGGVGNSVTIGNVTVDLEGTVGGNVGAAGVSSRVQAVADWFGATDFLQMRFYPTTVNHDASTSDESHLVGGPIQTRPEQVASADPITFISADDPPFLVMHGTVDDLIPFNQSELLVEALRAASVPVTFTPVQGVGHGGSGWETSANYQPVYDFFDASLKNLGAPRVAVTATANAAEAGRTPGRFTLTRTGGTAAPLTVRWALGGTASLGADYAAPASSATFPAGSASLNVTVTPVDDNLVEGDETVELRLACDPSYRIDSAHASASLTISDNDSPAGLPVVTIQATDPSAAEAGPDPGIFTVSVAGGFPDDLTVRYTVAGTAANGTDYAPLSGSLTIPAGQTSTTLEIDPVADGLLETAETVLVTLAPSGSYAVGSPATAGVDIADADRDLSKSIVSVAATDPDAAEPGGSSNNGAFTVTRTGSTSPSLSFYLHIGGSAQNGGDYGFLQDFRTFASGVSSMVLTVSTLDDTEVEGPEDVTLTVVPNANIQIGPHAARVVIQDNEPSPGLDGFYTLTPCRLADTRLPAGPSGAPSLAAGETRVFPVSGVCGIPPDATAVSVNVTGVLPATDGFVTLFEPGAALPVTSTLNLRAGLIRSNNGIFHLLGHPSGLAVYAGIPGGTVIVVIDVNGYFR
jgi:acetyl esterase/lipase